MRCKNYEPKDSTTNLQAKYDNLKMAYKHLFKEGYDIGTKTNIVAKKQRHNRSRPRPMPVLL